jgi:lipid-A-disaccharide synthase
MARISHLLIVVGDPSADRHAAALVQALKRRSPGLRITAFGGDHLKAVADTFAYPLVGVGGFGFWEPIFKIPQLWRVRQQIARILQSDPPDLVVPIDYYGFNIHVARLAKDMEIPVIYYISPQVWASRPGRIRALAQVVQRMLVIFPFEEALYRSSGVPVTYVGHPLVERLPPPAEPRGGLTIGLLPGSRPGTVARHLPILCETADRLRIAFPEARFLLFRPEELGPGLYASSVSNRPWIELTTDEEYRDRQTLTLSIGVSGTAALENMLLGIPMIVMYRLSPLTYWLARALVRIRYIGIPNILANDAVVPELIQDAATPEALSAAAAGLLRSPERRTAMRDRLLSLRSHLQAGGIERAAESILAEITSGIPEMGPA